MDELRPLEGRKPIVDEVYELRRCCLGVGIKHDRRADILAEPRMRHGESLRLAYRRMAQQRLFDIVRRYLLAAAVDDFLGAADDGEKAIFVDAADVAGCQPAIPKSTGTPSMSSKDSRALRSVRAASPGLSVPAARNRLCHRGWQARLRERGLLSRVWPFPAAAPAPSSCRPRRARRIRQRARQANARVRFASTPVGRMP